MNIPIKQPIRTRIAPTPSGLLHIGNALSFLYTWLLARKTGGSLQLRIDDIDSGRVRNAYLKDIFEQLAWLQIDWDTGPKNITEFHHMYSQQHYLSEYQQWLDQLQYNKQLFACTCSRSQIKARSSNGIYTGTCRQLNRRFEAPNTAWRISVPTTPIVVNDLLKGVISINLSEEMGDFVLRKKDKKAAYQLVSVAEDLKANTTLIVRGEDLLASTASQIYIAQQLRKNLDFEQIQFIHHPLLVDETGRKLSKSEGAIALKQIRQANPNPSAIYQRCAKWLGIDGKVDTLQQLLDRFEISHFPQ